MLRGLDLSDVQRQQYDAVKNAFDRHFVPRKNVIYECAKFNKRVQQLAEPVDSFIKDLYALTENCEYGALHYELLRDRLVAGLRDSSLSERMQLNKDLTLTKAITMARQSEEIKRQQTDLRCESNVSKTAIDAVHTRQFKPNKFKNKEQKQLKFQKPRHAKQDNKTCYKCGKAPANTAAQCPAKNAECHNCGRRGQYSKACKSKSAVNEVAESADGLFLGELDQGEDPWPADIDVRDTNVRFKLDSGAAVTAISEQTYKNLKQTNEHLDKAEKPLFGPGGNALNVLGSTTETISYADRSTTETIYVVRNLHVALLSRTASVRLKLIARVDSIYQETVERTSPKLCEGLGLVQKPYTIKLKPGWGL